jgi:hypothetical protein
MASAGAVDSVQCEDAGMAWYSSEVGASEVRNLRDQFEQHLRRGVEDEIVLRAQRCQINHQQRMPVGK